MWTTEAIGVLVSGLTALLTVLGAAGGRIASRLSADSRAHRREIRLLRDKQLLAERYLFAMARVLEHNGIEVPTAPAGLFEEEMPSGVQQPQ